MRIRFECVTHKAVKRWVDADGKKHQQTMKFMQTLNPFNKDADGFPKSREQIWKELKAQAAAWLAQPPERAL